MTDQRPVHPFRLLAREFFGRLFMTESPVSDHQRRTAMIGVFAFVVTPGLFVPLQFAMVFREAAHDPLLLGALTRLFATTFLAYSIVVIGMIAALEWDELLLDRRDAIILGPLPVSGAAVVAAKIAALAALVGIVAGSINGLTALTFSFVAASHQGLWTLGRTIVAHLVSTMAASTFIFCGLVVIRCASELSDRSRIVVGSVLQFALVSGLFCFLVLAPTAVHLEFTRQGGFNPVVHVQTIPAWLPTHWFAALYDLLRGPSDPATTRAGFIALALTAASVACAAVAVSLGYRLQLQRALASAESSAPPMGLRWARTLGRRLAGRDVRARGVVEFMLTTLMRNRVQQTTVAINGAIAVVMLALDLSFHRNDVLRRLSAFPQAPLIIVFWVAVGLRASFYVPAERPAAWVFDASDASLARQRHASIRGALAAILLPVAVIASVATSIGMPWRESAAHVMFVAAATLLLIELVALMVRFVPYTRCYEPGHAKLKSRWPFYLASFIAFTYVLVDVETVIRRSAFVFIPLTAAIVLVASLLDRVGQSAAVAGTFDAAATESDQY